MGTTDIVPIIDHLIIVGLPASDRKMVIDTWNKGIVDIQPVGNGCIRYCLEYIDKQVFGASQLFESYGDFEPPFAHFSKGLGVDWIKNNLSKFDKYGTITFGDSGKTYTLNPYYRDKFGFENKPYEGPYQESVKKYAAKNHLDLYTAYIQRNKLKEQELQHKQIKSREPLYRCSKAIIKKELDRLGNKTELSVEQCQAFTSALLQADDFLKLSKREIFNPRFPGLADH